MGKGVWGCKSISNASSDRQGTAIKPGKLKGISVISKHHFLEELTPAGNSKCVF